MRRYEPTPYFKQVVLPQIRCQWENVLWPLLAGPRLIRELYPVRFHMQVLSRDKRQVYPSFAELEREIIECSLWRAHTQGLSSYTKIEEFLCGLESKVEGKVFDRWIKRAAVAVSENLRGLLFRSGGFCYVEEGGDFAQAPPLGTEHIKPIGMAVGYSWLKVAERLDADSDFFSSKFVGDLVQTHMDKFGECDLYLSLYAKEDDLLPVSIWIRAVSIQACIDVFHLPWELHLVSDYGTVDVLNRETPCMSLKMKGE